MRFLDQLRIQPDTAGFGVATAPFGFHAFDAPCAWGGDFFLPAGQNAGDFFF